MKMLKKPDASASTLATAKQKHEIHPHPQFTTEDKSCQVRYSVVKFAPVYALKKALYQAWLSINISLASFPEVRP